MLSQSNFYDFGFSFYVTFFMNRNTKAYFCKVCSGPLFCFYTGKKKSPQNYLNVYMKVILIDE